MNRAAVARLDPEDGADDDEDTVAPERGALRILLA